MKETRREDRLSADLEIRFRYPEVFEGLVRDYSSGGVGADIPLPLDVDSPVEMEIFEGRLLASGHVRWVTKEDGTIKVGIQFREGERELIEQIHAWKGAVV